MVVVSESSGSYNSPTGRKGSGYMVSRELSLTAKIESRGHGVGTRPWALGISSAIAIRFVGIAHQNYSTAATSEVKS